MLYGWDMIWSVSNITGALSMFNSFLQAVASEGGTEDAKRRGDAFARAFSAHLARY